MLVPEDLASRARGWDSLKRWERRELARDLRMLGLSYGEIMAHVPASKASLSAWCRDVVLDAETRARLRSKRPSLESRIALGARRALEARQRHDAIRASGRVEAARFAGDAFWTAGVVAYWSEGAKTSNELIFANSDTRLAALFVRWCAAYLDVGADRLVARLHLHSGQDERERRRFWSAVLGIPEDSFRRSFIKPEGTGHRKNVLWAGTITIRARRSCDLFHRVMGWIDAVATNHGCGRPSVSCDAHGSLAQW